MDPIALKVNGYTDLPPGKIANVATFLEMTAPAADSPALPTSLVARRVVDPDPAWYRDLITEIGTPWLWAEIPLMPEEKLRAALSSPLVEIHMVERDGETIGVAELDRRNPGEVEIVIFGVVPAAIGTGAAHHLMSVTLAAAFRDDTKRVWLHTCTNDHPAAVGFYRRAGFVPYKFSVEVMDDPRLTAGFPETAAPHIALIKPQAAQPDRQD
ncbi:MAG: GNAT family N-acetyltransferase [Hyphomicrobiales bacterium]|nr:GNAT family N-acetyltransferase [Hyphomicrobiales bacterium]